MRSVCISGCLEDASVPVRVRATYTNLYKWPESDAEFVRSVSFRGPGHPMPKVVDSISCRQLYLRSYTFTRKETVNEKTKKCIGRVKDQVVNGRKKNDDSGEQKGDERVQTTDDSGYRKGERVKKVKEFPCAVLKAIFRNLLFCSAGVDVMDVSA